MRVGISVGLAVPVTAGEPFEALLERADQAMYDNKRNPRQGS